MAANNKLIQGSAAVASGELIAALGSDTGGSIRQPAAFNGVVGFKPTYGRVSRYGLIAFSSSLDQIGPMTRNVKDNALMLNAIAGQDKHDFTTSPREVPDFTSKIGKDIKGMHIGVPKEFMDVDLQPEVREAVQNAIKTFESLGATVDEISLPHSLSGIQVYYIVATSEASSNLQRYDGIRYGFRAKDVKNLEDVYVRSRSEGFGDEVKRRIMLGTFSLSSGLYDEFFGKATKVRTLICNEFDNVFKDYDLILGPTTTTAAFGFGEKTDDPIAMYMNDLLTICANTLFVLENLNGVSFERTDLPKALRNQNKSWAFYQLEQFLTYKAHLHNSEVVEVSAKYTSQRCPKCGVIKKDNRHHEKHEYHCTNCGYCSNDDRIGAMNIQLLGTQYISGQEQPKFELTTNA